MSGPLKPGITLMEASAGTGKTFRIAHNVLRLVAEVPVSIDGIVVVTFTRAATRELSDRVRARLRDGLIGVERRLRGEGWSPPDEVLEAWRDGISEGDLSVVRERLRSALVDFDEALISTIHGFCAEMLRRNAFESGAAFDVDLVGDARGLLGEIVVDFWTRVMWDADPAMLPALEAGGITRKLLAHLADQARDPDLPVIPAPEIVGPPDLTDWRRQVDALVAAWDEEAIRRLLLDGDDLCRRKKQPFTQSFPPGRTSGDIESIASFLKSPGLTGWVPRGMAEMTPDQIAGATLPGHSPPTHPFFDLLDDYIDAHEALFPEVERYTRSLKHQLVDEVRRVLPERSVRDNVRTYDDLLRDLRDGLRHPTRGAALAAAIRGQYQVALIDEFQDTDPVQWEVFRTVFTDTLVLIGDPKQAVYSFRGADVFTYMQASKLRDHEEPLDRNFRSDKGLIDALNHLFLRARQPFGAEEPKYREIEAHHPPSRLVDDDRAPLELRWLTRDSSRGARVWDRVLAKWFVNSTLPKVVADDIATELARGTRIRTRDGSRPIRPSDCAVLVFANWQAAVQQRALRDRGIPAVVRGDASVFESWVRDDLLTVLAAVLTPTDATALRHALVTRLMGRTGDDLADLERSAGRWNEVAASFRGWNQRWEDGGFVSMFRDFLDSERVSERLLERGDARAATDLAHLGELLHDAETRHRLGPSGLHRWLSQGGRDLEEDAATLRLETDADAVQVVTMHSAKGLEYPLVWCPSLLTGGWLGDEDKAHLKFHDPANDDRLTLDLGSPDKARNLDARTHEKLQEDLRLIYVALTRARHRVVVYWGIAAYFAPLGYLLHQKDKDPDAQLLQSVKTRLRSDDKKLRGEIEALASEHADICMSEVDWRLSNPAPDPEPPEGPRRFMRAEVVRDPGPDRFWRRSSFSALTRGVDPFAPHPEVDRDEPETADEGAPTDAEDEVTMADLWGGAAVGNAIHAVYEHLDFQDRSGLRELVVAQFVEHGIDAAFVDATCQGLEDSLLTPLDDSGLRLADLPRARRLDELAFTFPVRGGFDPRGEMTVADLASAFDHPDAPAGYAARLRTLGFLPLRGFLVGAIDLVFEHGGRWYVADYKSNKLGRRVGDYTRASLTRKMSSANYQLQAHLYVVAVHRFLGSRLTDYDYDTHIGGFRYLFVRGMHPSRGASTGVYGARPSKALIERLDRALGGGA